MAIAHQVICAALIVSAVIFFIYKSRKANVKATKVQSALAVFQIILCGWYFSLCLSDILDFQTHFSLERAVVNLFYVLAFLAIAVYALFNRFKEDEVYFKGVIWAYLVLIIVQCFVFPYGTEERLLQIFEDVEGALIFGLLIAFLLRLKDAPFGQRCLIIITALELIVAVENVIVPFASITNDFQPVDIPLNYASLFMRPVLFASLALAYRAWLERRGLAKKRRIGKHQV